MVWSIILLTVTSPNELMAGNKSFDSSKEKERSQKRLNYTSKKCCLSLNMDQKNKPSFYAEK
jgi:hypothetical protein